MGIGGIGMMLGDGTKSMFKGFEIPIKPGPIQIIEP